MLILTFIFGVLIGNYGTTLLFRIPRGIEICGVSRKVNTPPHCSECGHKLQFYEYLPILSWIFSRFKCNYCGVKINPQYLFLELSTAITSVVIYKLIGLSEAYLLLVALYITTAVAGLINLNAGKIYRELTFAVMTIGMLYKTLSDASIIPFIFSFSIGSIIISLLMSKAYSKELIHIILQSSILGVDVMLVTLLIYRIARKKAYCVSLISLLYLTLFRDILILQI